MTDDNPFFKLKDVATLSSAIQSIALCIGDNRELLSKEVLDIYERANEDAANEALKFVKVLIGCEGVE